MEPDLVPSGQAGMTEAVGHELANEEPEIVEDASAQRGSELSQ
jgi:hypothetical protein